MARYPEAGLFKALLALPPKETHQVLEKINLLVQDPTPDAKVKKQLKHMNGRLHRLRSGDFRIFYTFEQPYISILALRRRDDYTYDEDMDAEFLGGLDLDFDEGQTVRAAQPDWEQRCQSECCVTVHSRNVQKLGLDWVERFLTLRHYTKSLWHQVPCCHMKTTTEDTNWPMSQQG